MTAIANNLDNMIQCTSVVVGCRWYGVEPTCLLRRDSDSMMMMNQHVEDVDVECVMIMRGVVSTYWDSSSF